MNIVDAMNTPESRAKYLSTIIQEINSGKTGRNAPPCYDLNLVQNLFNQFSGYIGKETKGVTLTTVQPNTYVMNSAQGSLKYLTFDLYLTGNKTGCRTTFLAQLMLPFDLSSNPRVILYVLCPLGHKFQDHPEFDKEAPNAVLRRNYAPTDSSARFSINNVSGFFTRFCEAITIPMGTSLFTTTYEDLFSSTSDLKSDTESFMDTMRNSAKVISNAIKLCRSIGENLRGSGGDFPFDPLTEVNKAKDPLLVDVSRLCAIRNAISELDGRLKGTSDLTLSSYDLEKLQIAYRFLTLWELEALSTVRSHPTEQVSKS